MENLHTNSFQVTDAEIFAEQKQLEDQKEYEKLVKEEMRRLKINKKKKKVRIEIEQRFIGGILRLASLMEIRKYVLDWKISWRRFVDPRHRAIWRALEVLDLLSVDERKKLIEKEIYADANAEIQSYHPLQRPDIDFFIRGAVPGCAADKQFQKTLEVKSSGIAWLERGLESAGALGIAGGKVYLRKIAEIGKNDFLSDTQLAKIIF